MEKEIRNQDSILERYEILTSFDEDENVFLVRDRLTKELLVEKIISVHNPALYRELLRHPMRGIPHISRIDEVNGKNVLIEEYIHGLNLMQVVQNRGPLSEYSTAQIMIELCDILEQFHSMSPPVIHRDVKPGNIILSNSSEVYLIDFNISREYKPDSTLDTVSMISHHFSAPESYGFSQTDPRSDIYSIGASMHYLLTGGYLNDTTYDGLLSDIIGKCTSMDPANRFQSVSELKRALVKNKVMSVDDTGNSPFSYCNSAGWRGFLPPGFRSGKILNMLVASAVYVFLFCLCFTLKTESTLKAPLSIIDLWTERIGLFAFFILSILFAFDYRAWLERMPGLNMMTSRPAKILLIVFMLFSVLLGAIVIVVNFLGLFQ